MGAPLLCSRLTESGPVSEAAQAHSIERLAPFEGNLIQYPNVKLYRAAETPFKKSSFLTSGSRLDLCGVIGYASVY